MSGNAPSVSFKGRLIRWLVTAIGMTLRYRVDDPEHVLDRANTRSCVFVFWHNRIFLMPHLFRRYWLKQHGRQRVAVLVSRSKDGAFLSDVLAAFQLQCVRGSTSRGGKAALRELTRLVNDGFDIGITPDGPRGPRYVLQPGCVNLAQLTGASIVPVSYGLSSKITFKSWDAFMVPLPFSRCTVRLGLPIQIRRDASDDETEQKRRELEITLRALGD